MKRTRKKATIDIWIPNDILAWLRSKRDGHISRRVNALLRAEMKRTATARMR